uniref:DUF4283 domain-containing protein n=1 Tax=Cannabis sativa TaxID=3483 RepID=A0A803Q311_CANSA
MVSSSGSLAIEEQAAGITLDDEEIDFSFVGGKEEPFDVRWCLVGRFLNAGLMDFQAMQNMIAFLWKLVKGLYVKELDNSRYLFQFYHEEGDNPRTMVLNRLDLWVQVFDLQHGYRSEMVLKGIGNYVGTYVESDVNNFSGVWREYLKIWFCEKAIDEQLVKPYGVWMKVNLQRKAHMIGSQWLRSGKAVSEESDVAGGRFSDGHVERGSTILIGRSKIDEGANQLGEEIVALITNMVEYLPAKLVEELMGKIHMRIMGYLWENGEKSMLYRRE